MARKHLAAIVKPLSGGEQFWKNINQISDAQQQFAITLDFLKTCN